jgi:putative endonuclease
VQLEVQVLPFGFAQGRRCAQDDMIGRAAGGCGLAERRGESSRMRSYYVYILASRSRNLYIGVTNDLHRRVRMHRDGQVHTTANYRIGRLVYVETTHDVRAAIAREKQLKGWVRRKKLALISAANPGWDDLAPLSS